MKMTHFVMFQKRLTKWRGSAIRQRDLCLRIQGMGGDDRIDDIGAVFHKNAQGISGLVS